MHLEKTRTNNCRRKNKKTVQQPENEIKSQIKLNQKGVERPVVKNKNFPKTCLGGV